MMLAVIAARRRRCPAITAAGCRLRALVIVLWRSALRRLAHDAGIRRPFAPHQLHHCHAIELVREGVPVHILQRQLGHAYLAVTTVYLAGVAPEEVLAVAQQRKPPSVLVSTLIGAH